MLETSSIAITLDTYSHVIPGLEDVVGEAMETCCPNCFRLDEANLKLEFLRYPFTLAVGFLGARRMLRSGSA